MFFESAHSLQKQEFRCTRGKNLKFPLHLHRSFEFCLCRRGQMTVTVGERQYLIGEGEAVLVFPFQIHAYHTEIEAHFTLCIFSPDMVPDFYRKTEHCLPVDNLFSCPEDIEGEWGNVFLQRALTYRICGLFDRGAVYRAAEKKGSADILTRLLLYADRHFLGECLLRDAAAELGYDYAYLSKFFKRKTGFSFRAYVNLLRLNESVALLTSSDLSIAEIAARCGFGCMRSFDREFRQELVVTPAEYRKQHRSGGFAKNFLP
ncbi:MAG: helix-turn-helix transcriptional regulator [Clostridia bacterium]|nr:helix-turn-helix transcriptional regulator [Clostridia bacterium]